jgi:hypothetical protein
MTGGERNTGVIRERKKGRDEALKGRTTWGSKKWYTPESAGTVGSDLLRGVWTFI